MTNWYKKAQLSKTDILEDHGENYLSIGHEHKYDKNNPVYIWILYNGEILSEEESLEDLGHWNLFPNISFGKIFRGRFESSTGKLSISRPFESLSGYRAVPKSILYKLYQKFPGIKQIYVF